MVNEQETQSIKIFGVRFDKVNLETAYNRFVKFMNGDTIRVIYTPNPEFIMKAQENETFYTALSAADLVIPDGIGVILASKIHKLGLTERVPGIEMMEKILQYCNNTGHSVYLFGGKPGVAELASSKIKEKYTNIEIKGFQSGYFEDKDKFRILDDINEKKPDVLFVALGAPRQEIWIYENRNTLNTKVAMGVGGALDVWAGVVKRAPKVFQKLGLEWFYRLLMQPSRFFRMMVLPQFLLKVLLTKNIEKKL